MDSGLENILRETSVESVQVEDSTKEEAVKKKEEKDEDDAAAGLSSLFD